LRGGRNVSVAGLERQALACKIIIPFDTIFWYRDYMIAKHRRLIELIFARPVPSSIRWAEIEALLVALGAERSEGRGSRVRFLLNGAEAVFHRPHPRPETDKGAVVSVREFLKEAGVEP
jgi:hypothetical protein